MFKKSVVLALVFVCAAMSFAQEAEDIIVPAGYRVEKLANFNPAADVQGLTKSPQGDLLVGSQSYMFFRADSSGNLTRIAHTRKHGISPTNVVETKNRRMFIYSSRSNFGIFEYTSPDTFKLVMDSNTSGFSSTSVFSIYEFEGGSEGYLYVLIIDHPNNQRRGRLLRFNGDGDILDTIYENPWMEDFVFDESNNLYFLERIWDTGQWVGTSIWKIPTGTDNIPDSSDAPVHVADVNFHARHLAVDQTGKLYVSQEKIPVTDGFSQYWNYDVHQIDPLSGDDHVVAKDLEGLYDLLCDAEYLYASEFDRGVISRVNLTTLQWVPQIFTFAVRIKGN